MKKTIKTVIAMLMIFTFTFALAACSQKGGSSSKKKGLKVVLLVPGNLGDKSYFDAANKGMKLIEKELNATTKVIEMGGDKTKWQPAVQDACGEDYDVIISGGDATEILNDAAKDNTDKKFINYDTTITETPENVYSMDYATNELSFLSGSLAALVTSSNMPNVNKDKVIGFLGGMDIPGINDFLVGYIQGAQYVDPSIKVNIAYAGDFANPGKGKELGLLQYNSNVDISFNVAGGTGLGLLDAAKNTNKYAIGVDSDQAEMFKDSDKKKAEHIVTSATKKIDMALLRAVKKAKNGTLKYGKHEKLGFKEGGVGIAKNEFYNQLVPKNIQTKVQKIEDKLKNGEIKVNTAFGMKTSEISKIRNAVKP
ncbi:BMP family ABC transporter substrate-binding protein [Clostridium oryzae]|uniref:Membrane lipoprotein TmpC n=1 Tax=Clostridium oryzae TaxID=1450648 RepID=A0A1V4IK65_9CLOT|nr:BMP family ABC transporter substrate-binding protein [Clostridium oryzae]OPJ60214.1 membrane lipoprotein TmpC precursor [Clostridium oryzae]